MNTKLHTLVMRMSKLTLRLLIFGHAIVTCLASEVEAQRKPLDEIEIELIGLERSTLSQLIEMVESETDFRFAYQFGLIDNKNLSISDGLWDLRSLLQVVAKQLNISVKRVNESIVLSLNEDETVPIVDEEITFDAVISGQITDEEGEPLIGVTIIEKGTVNGTTTDISGNFRLDLINSNSTIVVSYVGFLTQEIVVGNQTTFEIQLQYDIESLEEVVVVGYGIVKKSDLTGAVSSVKSEDLVERPVPTIDQALQGRVAGATIRTNSAAPGGGMNIVIRGVGSINSNTQPLYVLNGIPVANVDNIPTEDVESVEILKDASATAIYGARGANGVVLVTTKTGRAGKPTLSYSNRFSFETSDTDLNLMNGSEFAAFYTEWEIAQGTDPANVFYNGSGELNPLPENAGNTDWFDEISRTGLQQNHNLSLSGGSEKNTYSVSLNYLDHKGVLVGSDYSRLSLNLNNTYEVNDWINVGLNIVVSGDDRNSVGENATLEGDGFSAINAALKMMPTLPIFDENGNFVENLLPGSQSRENPVAAATQ
ncbi:MAG: SusC/RagA family TonB-linked outer membrane protein, partial [Bacteroidota bacterium]